MLRPFKVQLPRWPTVGTEVDELVSISLVRSSRIARVPTIMVTQYDEKIWTKKIKNV